MGYSESMAEKKEDIGLKPQVYLDERPPEYFTGSTSG